MGELLQIDSDVEFFGPPDQDEGLTLRDRVNELLNQITTHERTLAGSYIRLGLLVNKAIQGRFWIGWGYESSGAFIDSIKNRIGRERSAIYECASVAEKLLPQINEADLERMGISRASLLKKFVQTTSRRVPPELLSAALDNSVTIAQFKSIVYNSMKQDEPIKGKWYDWGFYATPEEYAEIQQAVKLVPINGNVPDWASRLEIILSFAREFYSSNVNN